MMDEIKEELASLGARVDNLEDRADREEARLSRMDEIIADLRTAVAKVATKDDILDLRKDFGEKFDRQLADAQNAVPGKFAAIFAGGALLIAAIELFLHVH